MEEFEDGFKLSGSIKKSEVLFNSFNDHRIAMTLGIISSLLKGGGIVNNFDSVKISNPHFLTQLENICNG